MSTLRLGVLVSGGGTNLQAILDAVAQGQLDAEVRLVVSNKAKAFALERARRAGVPVAVVRHRRFSTREQFDQAVVEHLEQAGVQWVVLAGFMRVVTPVLLRAFPNRVINIHPALLPSFPGLDAQSQAIDYGVRFTGCTTHFVDEGTDTGPIIAQAVVPVLAGDTRDSLAQRLLEQEHRLMIQTLRWISEGRVALRDDGGVTRKKVDVRGVPVAGFVGEGHVER